MDAADAEVNAAEDVAIMEAVSENPGLSGRAARAPRCRPGERSSRSSRSSRTSGRRSPSRIHRVPDERKALGAKIKAQPPGFQKQLGDADALLRAAEDLPDDDDDDDNWADEDVEMHDGLSRPTEIDERNDENERRLNPGKSRRCDARGTATAARGPRRAAPLRCDDGDLYTRTHRQYQTRSLGLTARTVVQAVVDNEGGGLYYWRAQPQKRALVLYA